MAVIQQWCREIAEIVCMFEKESSKSFMELPFHLLIHLSDEGELVGVVSCCCMFFLKRYMKNLNGFVKQREKLRGSIVEGYIVYESFYYTSEYIKTIDDMPSEVVWDD